MLLKKQQQQQQLIFVGKQRIAYKPVKILHY